MVENETLEKFKNYATCIKAIIDYVEEFRA